MAYNLRIVLLGAIYVLIACAGLAVLKGYGIWPWVETQAQEFNPEMAGINVARIIFQAEACGAEKGPHYEMVVAGLEAMAAGYGQTAEFERGVHVMVNTLLDEYAQRGAVEACGRNYLVLTATLGENLSGAIRVGIAN